ncbi:MAG TPA: phosphate/phosphite/phosphonate ABC transporter substrate-binding protein [Candidatus Limnocylindria bacterium]|nr:phosphate/phosphite/phosphonate ABC transporter substrate-binding protein [Candidatus Limnocylindria bacterium]
MTISLVLLLALGGALAQESCSHRGKLDPLYCDENRDLVADPPKDKTRLVSPDTVVFTYAPVEDPAVYENVWADFLKHLERVTGKKTKYFGLQHYAAQIEAMRSGRLQISGFATGATVYAVNLAGAVPFALMKDAGGGPAGYHLAVITQARNDKINAVPDLKGKRVAHVSQTSSSGHQAPVYLFSKMGVVPGKDYQIAFSGKHDTSILGVVNGDYDAAAVADTVLERMINRGVVKATDVKTVYRSPVFPTAGFAYAHNLEPGLVEKIKEAFFTFKFEGTSLDKEFGKQGRVGFMPITYAKTWEPIIGMLEANKVVFSRESEDYKRLQKRGGD